MKTYPEYKPSGIDWLGEIPSHWAISTYKYHCTSRMGQTILKEDMTETGVPIYSATQDDSILGYITEPELLLHKGDLVIPARGNSIGYVSKVAFEKATCTQTTICSTQIRDINVDFLLYCSKAFKNTWFLFDHTAIPQITVNQVENNKVPLPPIAEQEAIAKYLDDVTGKVGVLIAEKQNLVEDLHAYRTSLITETVTRGLNPAAPLRPSGIDWLGDIPEHWEITALKYLTSKIGSGVTPRGGSEVYLDEGILFIRSQNVYPDGLHLDDPKYISDLIDESMSNTRVYTGDILLNITGASIGRCCVYTLPECANVNQHVCIIRPLGNLINTQFLCYILNSQIGQDQIALYQTGGNREGLNFEQLKNFAITLPPLPDQQAIADFLDEKTAKIDALIDELNKQLDELAEYKKAVISEAVTGKVDVRDWKSNN